MDPKTKTHRQRLYRRARMFALALDYYLAELNLYIVGAGEAAEMLERLRQEEAGGANG